MLANVLHDWGDAEAVSILRTVRAAMGAGAHLLVVENVLDAPGRSPEQRETCDLVDLHSGHAPTQRLPGESPRHLRAAGFASRRTS